MRWEDERYVRIYTRDTPEWSALSWEARALFLFMLRKCDRAGLIHLGKSGTRGLAGLVAMPLESVERALPELLDDGCCELAGERSQLVIPNFIEAQESKASTVERQRAYRERARDAARAGLPPASQRACSIYFIQAEGGGPIKIGRADDLAKRLVSLQTGRPDKLAVLTAAPGTRQHERDLHDLLAAHRERGEWFRDTPAVLHVVGLVRAHGPDAWPMLGNVALPETSPVASPETARVTSHVTSHSVPSRAVPSRKKLAGSAPADPRSSGDATYKAMVDAMYVLFHDNRGGDLESSGKDWKALQRLREKHEAAEIIRRWGNGVRARYKARCSCFSDLEARWNDCGAPEASQGPQARRSGAATAAETDWSNPPASEDKGLGFEEWK